MLVFCQKGLETFKSLNKYDGFVKSPFLAFV